MKRILVFVVLLVLVFAVSCSTAAYTLQSVEPDVLEKDGIFVKATALAVEENGAFNRIYFSFSNKSGEPFSFNDSSVTVYGGNKDTDTWKVVSSWNAVDFFNASMLNMNRLRRLVRLNASAAVWDAATGHFVEKTIVKDGETKRFSYYVYNPLDVMAAVSYAETANRHMDEYYYETMNFLGKNLLFSALIPSGETYDGLVYFPVDRKNPDYKITIDDEQFVFSRSNRENILNPWLDQNRTLQAFTFGHSANQQSFNLYYFLLSGKLLGFYTGLNLDYSRVEEEVATVGIPFGLSFKVCPHTYILAGAGVNEELNLNDSNEESFISADAELGVNLTFNFLDWSVLCRYDFMTKQFYADLGFGFAF